MGDVTLFADRRDAGRQLAGELSSYAGVPNVVVLGLARGGVPVAQEIALALAAPLDVFVVRKLGVPRHRELAFGALASGGVRVLNDEVIASARVTPVEIEQVCAHELIELGRREQAYRDDRPPPQLPGRTALVVDDGLATGATMRAALIAVRQLRAARVVCCVPVGPSGIQDRLGDVADDIVFVSTPTGFRAVGEHYRRFDATTDDEVRAALSPATEGD
jgi:putative phosphoribosyl transferase